MVVQFDRTSRNNILIENCTIHNSAGFQLPTVVAADEMGLIRIRTMHHGYRYTCMAYHLVDGTICRQSSLLGFRMHRQHRRLVRRLGDVAVQPLSSPLWRKHAPTYALRSLGILCLEDLERSDRLLVKLKYGGSG